MWLLIFILVLFPSPRIMGSAGDPPSPTVPSEQAIAPPSTPENIGIMGSVGDPPSPTVLSEQAIAPPSMSENIGIMGSAGDPPSPTVPSEQAIAPPSTPENIGIMGSVGDPPSPTVPSEQAIAPPATPENEEASPIPEKPLHLDVSTDDSYLHNPRLLQSPRRVENLSKSLARYPSFKTTESGDNDAGLDKTRSFSTALHEGSHDATDKDEETELVKLKRFTRSVSSVSSSDSQLGKFRSFSQSLRGSFRYRDSYVSDSEDEVDEVERLPSTSISKSSYATTDIDESTDIPDVISSPRSFSSLPKGYSADDLDLIAAAVTQNFWVSLKHQAFTASITPYKIIRPPKQDIRPIVIKGYKMVRSVTILRHSIRVPSEGTVVEMKRRLPELKKLLKEASTRDRDITEDFWWYTQDMEDWKMYDELEIQGDKMKPLTREGKKQSVKMGKRFRIFHKHLLPEKFDKNSITIKFIDCPRTKDTALNLVEGMFGKLPEGSDWYEQVNPNESVLKYDSTCPVWVSFKKSDFNRYLIKNFLNGDYMKAIALAVGVRCNLRENEFTVDDLILVYEICSFEISWRGSSVWCTLLTIEHMKVVEYAADLEFHIIAGYANVLNTKIPCKLYNDLMDNLLNNKNLKVLVYVTHLTAILKFLAFLGLYQDINIRLIRHRQRYDPEVEDRNWRTAYIGSFLTNVTFILFVDEKKRLFIQVRHQERPVHIPMCPLNTELLCPLDRFERIFERFSYGNCRFDEWCKERKILPKQDKKLMQKSFSVGERRKKWLKEENEAEKEAERKKSSSDEGPKKDYRRIKSAGFVEHGKTLEGESMTKAETLERELLAREEQAITSDEILSSDESQQMEKGKEDTDEGATTSEESQEKRVTTEKELSQEVIPKEKSEEGKNLRISRTSRFWAEYGDDYES